MEHLSLISMLSLLLVTSSMLLCSTTSAASLVPPALRSSFGEFCNKTVRCNSQQFLTCSNETCQCLKPDMMTFDSEINSCVTIAGESCRYTVFSNSGDEDQKSWTEEVKCLTNAKCNTVGICECDTHFYEIGNGTCQPKGLYRSECQLDGQCREDFNFQCVDGTCNCDSKNNTSTYDYKSQNCVGLAGKNCIDQRCVSNARCKQTNDYYGNRNYDRPLYRCECNSNTEVSPEGQCLIPHQGSCDATYPNSNCFPGLKCQDGQCVCPYANYQYYDDTLKRCTTLVGGPCTNSTLNSRSSWETTCVTHSSCLPAKHSQVPECTCDPGFVKNPENKCHLGFGQSCPAPMRSLVCGKMQGLFCINGKCACEDGLQTYDFESSQCRGLVGSRCSNASKAVFNNFLLTCEKGSECVPKNVYPSAETVCRCKEGFALDENTRTCSKIQVQNVSKRQDKIRDDRPLLSEETIDQNNY